MVANGSSQIAGADVPETKPKRVRNPEARRATILAAARSVFAERGYTSATIREIARRAGVTHGLLVLHFSTKEQLFLAAMPGADDLAENVPGDREGLPERIARAYVSRMETAGGAEPFIALVRSAAVDQDTAKVLLQSMRERSIEGFRQALDGSDFAERIDLLGALTIGVTFNRYLLADGPLATMSAEELIEYLTPTIASILLGDTERHHTSPSRVRATPR
jgi:AcrR family transcriptional regulator